MTQTKLINFIMTGSIAGGRGLEALLVLRQLPLSTPYFGRCVVVVWEEEARGAIFDEIQTCEVDVIVLQAPSRTSFGFMERQYKSLVAAMHIFEAEDVLVKIRTDYNYLLSSTLAYLNKIIAANKCIKETLRGRIVCGEISIIHPGRIQEFNFAGLKQSWSLINWCESYYTDDYIPVAMEPEFRWFGMHFVMADPLFHYCYENRNMRALMRDFFNKYKGEKGFNVDALPAIIKYMGWRMASISFEKFICAMNLGTRNIDPNIVYNASRNDVAVYHDNIPDLRITSHLVLADIAGIGPVQPMWRSYLEEAWSIRDEERKSPGKTIELFEKEFGPSTQLKTAMYSGQRFTPLLKEGQDNSLHSPLFLCINQLAQASASAFESFRDFPSHILYDLRTKNQESCTFLCDHILQTEGLFGQMTNRYAAFCVTIFCVLVHRREFIKATTLLAAIIQQDNIQGNMEELVQIIAFRSKRFLNNTYILPPRKPYHLPHDALEYDMLKDLSWHLEVLKAKVEEEQQALVNQLQVVIVSQVS